MATLMSLLATLQDSITAATAALPSDPTLLQIEGGISLFETKNELFLSYLHNLVFLILFKIREKKVGGDSAEPDAQEDFWNNVVKNLVGLRLYSDKGVKPLENKLRYEIDRVIQAAEDAAKQPTATPASKIVKKSKKGGVDEADSEDQAKDGENPSGSDEDEDDSASEEEEGTLAPAGSTQANLRDLALPPSLVAAQKTSKGTSTGAYRPPRIAPTAMPTTSAEERRSRARPTKSRTLDEYLDEEVSGAPAAMPSIGSNIVRAGARTQTARERREDAERQNYEESNYVRLPALSKKEQRQRESKSQGRGYGGEEWMDLGAGAERLMKDLSESKRKTSKLERSRKRNREEPVDAGPNGMSSFEKRRKRTMERRKR